MRKLIASPIITGLLASLALAGCATTITVIEGEVVENWDNGKPKVRGFVQNGVRHGEWKYFNQEGELAREEHYMDSAPDGTWKRYPEKEPVPIYLTEPKQMIYVQFFTGDPAPSIGSVNYAKHIRDWVRMSGGIGTGNLGRGGGGITFGTQAQFRLPRWRVSPVIGIGPSVFLARGGAGSRFPQFTQNQIFLNGEAGIEYLGERKDDPILRGIGITSTLIPEFAWGFFVRLGIIF